jgi:hypothetical protein
MYGPAYQIRPVSAGFTLRNDKHLYEGHYDEHLNKMARLSSELNAYYPVMVVPIHL